MVKGRGGVGRVGERGGVGRVEESEEVRVWVTGWGLLDLGTP